MRNSHPAAVWRDWWAAHSQCWLVSSPLTKTWTATLISKSNMRFRLGWAWASPHRRVVCEPCLSVCLYAGIRPTMNTLSSKGLKVCVIGEFKVESCVLIINNLPLFQLQWPYLQIEKRWRPLTDLPLPMTTATGDTAWQQRRQECYLSVHRWL